MPLVLLLDFLIMRTQLRSTRFVAAAAIVVLIIFKIWTDKQNGQPKAAAPNSVGSPSSPFMDERTHPEQPPRTAIVDWADKADKVGGIDKVDMVDKAGYKDHFDEYFAKAESYERENATFVTLARNSDLWSLVDSIRHVEDRFNHKYHYDWVFLNDEEFDEGFKKVIDSLTSGKTYYGKIPSQHWSYPSWIDQEKAAESRRDLEDRGIIYGGSESYRHMCRFESGFFYRHPLMNKYKYYWRVEPDIKLHCDITYDVFKFMAQNKKKYGFSMSLYEYVETIPTLWDTTMKFLRENPNYRHKHALMDFISEDGGQTYNNCHFWSNFEIADMDFWRSDAYRDYFSYLDKSGGFFYERWGDAPVHSLAAALFLDQDEIHFFDDVGYYHVPYNSCPVDEEVRLKNRCSCNPDGNFFFDDYSCTQKYYKAKGLDVPTRN